MLPAMGNGVKGGKWYSLMDKVYAPKTLAVAWAKVRTNKGAAGVDGQSISDSCRARSRPIAFGARHHGHSRSCGARWLSFATLRNRAVSCCSSSTRTLNTSRMLTIPSSNPCSSTAGRWRMLRESIIEAMVAT